MWRECLVSPEDLGPFLLGQLEPTRGSGSASSSSPTVVQRGGTSAAPGRVGLGRPAHPPTRRRCPGPGRTGRRRVQRLLASIGRERAKRRWCSWRVIAAAAAAKPRPDARRCRRGRLQRGRRRPLGGARRAGVGSRHRSPYPAPWDTSIVLTVRGLQPDKPYAWLQARSGDRVPAGTFTPAPGGSLELDPSAQLPIGDAAAVGVTQLVGEEAGDPTSARPPAAARLVRDGNDARVG